MTADGHRSVWPRTDLAENVGNPSMNQRARAANAPHRVLVIDDCPDAAEVVCVILQLYGHQARSAHSGRDALAEACVFLPSIVILDLSLPDLSGCDVARALRARPGGRDLHIAALSGWAEHEKREAALEAGCDQYALKPADAATIRGILNAADSCGQTSPK